MDKNKLEMDRTGLEMDRTGLEMDRTGLEMDRTGLEMDRTDLEMDRNGLKMDRNGLEILNAELGRLCPFSAPRGHTFSTCPPRFSPRVFHGQIFTSDKHKVSAPGPNAPHPKVIQIIRP